MKVRWWRVHAVFEKDGDPCPWTWTLHVRAFREERARALVAERIGGPHTVYVCQPSEPLQRVEGKEEIVAEYGPYRRSWKDPALQRIDPGTRA